MLEFNQPKKIKLPLPIEDNFLMALPHNYPVSDQRNLIQFKSQTKKIDSINFHPQDWVFRFDLVGELQGKIYAKFLINEKNKNILENKFAKDGLIADVHQFLTNYFHTVEEKYDYMTEVLAGEELGLNIIPPASLQINNENWIRFQSRYIYMSTDFNIPVDLCFQFIKKGSGHV